MATEALSLAQVYEGWESHQLALVRALTPLTPDQLTYEAIPRQEAAISEYHAELLRWLEATWQMIETTLARWTVADLAKTYRHFYQGKVYAVSRQWTLWRVMSHDLHHGGEVAFALGMQGVEIPDLGDQGGHLTELPLADAGG